MTGLLASPLNRLALITLVAVSALAQTAPNVSQVLMYSTVRDLNVRPDSQVPFLVTQPFTLRNSMLGIFSVQNTPVTLTGSASDPWLSQIGTPSNYGQITSVDLTSALNANVATALSTIPLASPASGLILKLDSATGAAVPASSSLGPVFTERAETIGKRKFYAGVTHQSFQFGSVGGNSLNGLRLFYGGGQASTLNAGGTQLNSYPATFDVGLDVRLSQSTAFFTFGVTNNFDIAIGLPMVHSAVAARTYNVQVYGGLGLGQNTAAYGQPNCWCSGSLSPGERSFTETQTNATSLSSTGIGDVLLRFKGIAHAGSRGVLALGTDLRLPSGDAENYHGIGTAAVKPFAAYSWLPRTLTSKVVIAPHLYAGWQFTGKSVLGGTFTPTQLTANATSATGATQQVRYLGAPFLPVKNYLPDVLSWSVGTELAFGARNTFILDFLGNQIGAVHGIPQLRSIAQQGLAPGSDTQTVNITGLTSTGPSHFGQYNASFGYKARLAGNLVLTLNGLVRLDSNGLTARFVPLYGLGYSF